MSPLEASTLFMSRWEEIRFFPDEWLGGTFLESLLSFVRPRDVPRVHAEILLRWWLYHGECPDSIRQETHQVEEGLRIFLDKKMLPLREKRVRHAERTAWKTRFDSIATPSTTERLLEKLILSYAEADGIFPVVRGEHAFPIPFKVELPRNHQGSVDAGPTRIPIWTQEAGDLWKAAGPFQLQILADIDPVMGGNLQGGSFALASALAKEWQGELCPFQWMATGSIRDGRIASVEGCEAKERLARKLGVRLWIRPGTEAAQENAGHGLILPVGTELDSAMDEVKSALHASGIWELSLSRANAILDRIHPRNSMARKPLGRAINRVRHALETLQKNDGFLRDKIGRGRLLLAELLNHDGREREADPIFRELLREFRTDWKLTADAGACWVVSLCYQGRLREAETEGEKLFKRIDSFPKTLQGLEARVKIAGSYGGDALLHLALRTGDPDHAQKSRECLEKNRAFARQIVDLAASSGDTDLPPKFSLGMSISRMAVWHALFQPETTCENVAQALSELPEHDANVDYLRRTRFLGAYRLLLKNGKTPSTGEVLTWDLPLRTAPHYIRATSLKYRGALRAAGGDFDGASADFEVALEMLQNDSSETISLIAWGIAAEAFVSLPPPPGAHDTYLRENAGRASEYLERFKPSRKLAMALRKGNLAREDLRTFQSGFAY